MIKEKGKQKRKEEAELVSIRKVLFFDLTPTLPPAGGEREIKIPLLFEEKGLGDEL
ncbi:MAG: hypothetical protein U9P79_08880 [Candidatus Cloacimonadota bacterium]|nr:hypothetical protein [Candidatus Cloacimonadota bacterium]